MHGLGCEHELAPAVLTEKGWVLLNVDLFNTLNSENTPNKSGTVQLQQDNRVLVEVPSRSKRKQVTASKGEHAFASGPVVYSMDGELAREEEYVDEDRTPGPFAQRHAAVCAKIAALAQMIAAKKGWNKISATCIISSYDSRVYIRQSNELLPADFEKALVKATSHIVMYGGNNTERFELDSGFIEIKSNKPKNATVESIAKELEAREKEVVKFAKLVARHTNLVGTVGVLPHGQVVLNGTDAFDPGAATYAGSYHVWMTLPHKLGPAFDHMAFVQDHRKLVCALQWLQPLLLACMPCDPRSPGSGQRYSRASMRSRLNTLSGFGVASIPETERRNVLCYASLDALNRGEAPTVISTNAIWMVTDTGAKLNLLACAFQERTPPINTRGDWTTGAGFRIHHGGTDVRLDTCWSCSVRPYSQPLAFVKTKGGIHAAVFDKETGTYAMDKTCTRATPVGIEFRVFDHLPSEHVRDLLSIVVLAAAASGKCDTRSIASEDPAWILQMRDSAAHGSRVPVSKDFWAKVQKAFGVKAALPAHAFLGLNALLQAMHAKHGKNAVAKAYGLSKCPMFPDVNFPLWRDSVTKMMSIDSTLRDKLSRVIALSVAHDVLEKELGPGWRDDVYMLKALSAPEERRG